MYLRLSIFTLFGLLACGFVAGQESHVVAVPVQATKATKSDSHDATNFHLKGILISASTRMALVNGQPFEEGDRVDGVEILAIHEAGVQVLFGAQEFTVGIGGTVTGAKTANDVSNRSRLDANNRHAVKSGETLSGIASRYRRDGVTNDQMMAALFHANEQAFDDNINVLFEGSVLRIPDVHELRRRTPDTATAEIARHADRWQPTPEPKIEIAKVFIEESYGPVESGETLSGIAANVLRDGVTLDQMIIALFEANTHAFSDNINVLFAGATLRIPDDNELYHRTPATATAEVLRQTKDWQDSHEQHVLLTLAHSNIIAANDTQAN